MLCHYCSYFVDSQFYASVLSIFQPDKYRSTAVFRFSAASGSRDGDLHKGIDAAADSTAEDSDDDSDAEGEVNTVSAIDTLAFLSSID